MGSYDKYIYSKTTHYISNCGHDERRQYSGGQAGDQADEWEMIPWYKYPYGGGWKAVLRHPDPKVQLKLAELACASALNNKIGYDQAERYTFWTMLCTVGYDPSKITIPCEADCSSGVCSIIRACGYLMNRPLLKEMPLTSTHYMRDLLRKAGFILLTDSKYLTGKDYLQPSDILLNDQYHTAFNVTAGIYSGWKAPSEEIPLAANSNVKYTVSRTNKPNQTQMWVGEIVNNGVSVHVSGKYDSPLNAVYPKLYKGNQVAVCDSILGKDDTSKIATYYYVIITVNAKQKYHGFIHSDQIKKV